MKLAYHTRITIFSFLVMLPILYSSCKKLVEVDSPIDQIIGKDAYNNNANANAVILGIYYKFSQYEFYRSTALTLCADEMAYQFPLGTEYSAFYTNTLSSNDGVSSWSSYYETIYSCNSAIGGIQTSVGISTMLKPRLIAEAKLVRALMYLYLVNLYGEVPIVLDINYKDNVALIKSPVSAVYEQIIKDLNEARQDLPTNYVGSDGLTVANMRFRPSSNTASALLGRTYLYAKDWKNAEEMATSVISNNDFFELAPIDGVFLANSKEAIWQLQPVSETYNTEQAYRFIPNTVIGGIFPFSIRNEFYEEFDTDDLRKSEWVRYFAGDPSTNTPGQYYPYKYKAVNKNSNDPYEEAVPVIRLAEIYLIRSEARSHLGNFSGAEADLNKVRHRAGLLDYDSNVNGTLESAILAERKKEFFTEWGHRWLDLKRSGTINQIMPLVTASKGGTWEPYDALFPIPLSDLERSPNLRPQNSGY